MARTHTHARPAASHRFCIDVYRLSVGVKKSSTRSAGEGGQKSSYDGAAGSSACATHGAWDQQCT